jgi:hypothetical protein
MEKRLVDQPRKQHELLSMCCFGWLQLLPGAAVQIVQIVVLLPGQQ